ncbi:hypothetical protein PAMP_008271 [Pampus punctatissimus]
MDDIDFPALSAHVQDGRRGKVSVIVNLATTPTTDSYRLPLATPQAGSNSTMYRASAALPSYTG